MVVYNIGQLYGIRTGPCPSSCPCSCPCCSCPCPCPCLRLVRPCLVLACAFLRTAAVRCDRRQPAPSPYLNVHVAKTHRMLHDSAHIFVLMFSCRAVAYVLMNAISCSYESCVGQFCCARKSPHTIQTCLLPSSHTPNM